MQKLRRIAAYISISLVAKMLVGAAVVAGGVFMVSDLGRRSDLSPDAPQGNSGGPSKQNPSFSSIRDDAETLVPGTFTESAKLVAADGTVSDEFGFSVAISGDTVIVGASRDENYKGAAYVFTRNGAIWTFQQKLTGQDSSAEDSFGWSVAISGDTVAVGAYADDGIAADQGAVYIFTRSGTVWTQQQKLTASDASAGDQMGTSVALEGETVVAGAFGDDSARGSAYVFVRTGAVWNEQQKLTALDGASNDEFGGSVAISGQSAIVGAEGDDSSRGSAYVFIRSGITWSEQQKLTAADGAARDHFGHSVSISIDSAIVGAVLDETGGTARGAAYVFTRTGSVWSEQQKLIASDGAVNDKFGSSVAIVGDSIVVGSHGDDIGIDTDRGGAYHFARSGTVWTEQQKLTASDGSTNDNFGGSVAIGVGAVIVGGYLDDNFGVLDQGSAYIFTGGGQPTPTPTPTPGITPTPTPSPSPGVTPTPTPSPTPGATVSGRVTAPDGRGLRNAVVSLTDASGAVRTVTTSSFGFFSFADVPVGQSYTMRVSSKRYRFSPLMVNVDGDLSNIDFIGSE